MSITRRTAIGRLAGTVPALVLPRAFAQDKPAIQAGPFQGTRDSLKEYLAPQWFRDANFGIWAHWGPQSASEVGDWYARRMYVEGRRQALTHRITELAAQ
jgi:alpha-L-fucosidase